VLFRSLTALWHSAGVRPGAVLGSGVGEVSAALAAGVFTLEDGLRLAMATGKPGLVLSNITLAEPSVPLVSGMTGQAVRHAEELTEEHWLQVIGETTGLHNGGPALDSAGAGLAIVLGPQTGPETTQALKPLQDGEPGPDFEALDCLIRPGEQPEDLEMRYLKAVAASYEGGLSISFAGLFADEERRRIGIPGYPFQRRSFWVQQRRRASD